MLNKIHAGFIVALLVIILPLSVYAATTYTIKSGDTLRKIATANKIEFTKLVALNPQITNINLIRVGQVVTLSSTTSTSTKPAPPAPVTGTTSGGSVLVGSETRFSAYTTGYGWPDNTPKGSAEISDGIIHLLAGGVGTYSDPITLAVGHTISGSKDTLDYPAGTKFYIPTLRKYFIVEDTCGDGNTPQNGPCHTGYQGSPWLDLWVGGNSSNQSQTLACEDKITEKHLVIKNPASNYVVVSGDVASGCTLYGDTVVSK